MEIQQVFATVLQKMILRTFDGDISSKRTFSSIIYCTLIIPHLLCFRATADKIYLPVTSGSGEILAIMYLYKDENYIHPFNGVPVLKTTDSLYVEVSLGTNLPELNVVLKGCWITPSATSESERHDIIESPGCMKSDVVRGSITKNGDGHARFQFQVIKFVSSPEIVIHCSARICIENSEDSCKPVCPGSRERRDTSDNTRVLRSSAIIITDGEGYLEPPLDVHDFERDTLTTTDIPPIIIALIATTSSLLLICFIIILCLCSSRKKTVRSDLHDHEMKF